MVSAFNMQMTQHCYTTLPHMIYKNVQKKVNMDMDNLFHYSQESNLALNSTKTKWMLLSTKQMSSKQDLESISLNIKCSGKSIQRVSSTKLLGVHINQHLTWEDHITNTLSSCYGTLSVLRKIKNFAPLLIRKHIVESLVLSKLDYCNAVYGNIPDYQLKRLQRLQNSCAGYVLAKFAKTDDLERLGWLSIKKRLELSIAKLSHKSLYEQIPLKTKQHIVTEYNLRSLNAPKLEKASKLEKGTFQDQSSTVFNNLPSDLRNCTEHSLFCKNMKTYMFKL